MKKALSVSLAALFSLSLLSGCGSSSNAQAPAAATPAKTESSSAPASSAPAAVGNYADGTYKASYDHMDGHGWKAQISIDIKDKKIAKVNFDYVNADGKLKSQDAAYEKSMKAVVKVGPAEYIPQLNDSLVKTQDVSKVDTVTGATEGSAEFKALAAAALEKAAKGDSSEAILPMNTTYTATEPNFDSHGWKGQMSITFENGKITKVDYNEVNKDKKLKSDDAAYNKQMKDQVGVSDAEAYVKLDKQALENNGKVDIITGATETSKRFQTLYQQALAMRK